MSQSVNLLPCPFCGAAGAVTSLRNMYWGYCSNDDCAAEVSGKHTRELAVAEWNRRALSPPVTTPAESGGGDARIAAYVERLRDRAKFAFGHTEAEHRGADEIKAVVIADLEAMLSSPSPVVSDVLSAQTAVQDGAEPMLTGRGWDTLNCDDQYALAKQIAANVGYVLIPEPEVYDETHPGPFITSNSGGPDGYFVSVKVRSVNQLHAAHDRVLAAFAPVSASNRAPASIEETKPEPVAIGYTNWRGEYAVRTIIPSRVWFGSTEWHPEPQWLLTAIDAEKNAERDFAIKDIGLAPPSSVPEVTDAQVADWRGMFFWSDAKRRLWWIGEQVAAIGKINRSDVCEAFGVSVPQASADINTWIDHNPGALVYDKSAKCYVRAAAVGKR